MNRQERQVLSTQMSALIEQQAQIIEVMGKIADAIADVAEGVETANLIHTLTIDPRQVSQASIPTVAKVQKRLGLAGTD